MTCSALLDDFEAFWSAYPRKVGKGQARQAYAKAVKKAPHDEIMFGLSQQRPDMEAKAKKFIPHASTWLNGERWEDEPEPDNSNDTNAHSTDRQIAFAARAGRSPSLDSF